MNQKVITSRKELRLPECDYAANGYYFITICCKEREPFLATIVGDAASGVPCVRLTEIGEIVNQYIVNINAKYEHAIVDKYVIMPNHVHMIIALQGGTPDAASPTVSKIINALKARSSQKIGFSIWQRSFYDHVIRDEDDYQRIWEYIKNNPAKWAEDEYHDGNGKGDFI